MSASSDLTFALTHAIAYLTRPLIGRYSATTIDLLHFALERNLAKQYENNWFPQEPTRGSGRRCLTLAPGVTPPRPVYYAAKAARVNWDEWMVCLGNVEIDLFIDPGCVSVRFGNVNQSYIVWSASAESKSPEQPSISIVDEDDDEELFAMIADEIRAPTWMTPILSQFPAVPHARPSITSLAKLIIPEQNSKVDTNLLSVRSGHSRSSSFSSISDASGFSFSSVDTTSTPASSFYSPAGAKNAATPARKGRTPFSVRPRSAAKEATLLLPASTLIMQAPVAVSDDEEIETSPVVDASKKQVTPYDGGKTTVLTGGVMLGKKSSAPQTPRTPMNATRFVPTAVANRRVWAVRA